MVKELIAIILIGIYAVLMIVTSVWLILNSHLAGGLIMLALELVFLGLVIAVNYGGEK